jgi:hypothetical protein
MISVVIICKNVVNVMEHTLEAARKLTNDIVVVDSGSTDGTIELIHKHHCNLISTEWKGYGPTKNIGIAAAQYDWILSLDSDETIDEKLIESIRKIDLRQEAYVYKIHFLNYLAETPLRFGEWSGDAHVRLFNRKNTEWNNAKVHETLIHKKKPTVKTLEGKIHHKTSETRAALRTKLNKYALLNAQFYLTKGKQVGVLKKYSSALFNFIKNYLFKLGFLDGRAGWIVAYENARYSFIKYKYWEDLKKQKTTI